MSAFALVIPPAALSNHLLQLTQRSPTQQTYHTYSSLRLSLPLTPQRVSRLTTLLRKVLILRRMCDTPDAAASVLYFSPVTSSAQTDSTSELLRFL